MQALPSRPSLRSSRHSLRRRLAPMLLALLALAHGGGAIAQNIAALRQQSITSNTQQCQALLKQTPRLDPYAPRDNNMQATYCGCVARAYTAAMPDTLLIALANGKLQDKPGDAAARARAAAVHLDAARRQCAAKP
ncbi:hypothetical protein [Achromobacter aloeverae]|uniref:Uncharacterized protein n=1 Tax=Achromobacter aloeverae TaxID=1750518 RepID=A0A4Q1HEQ6_9BURK|nr:hypothetical protein [Achromobacter aloeverae]RXN85133.1 hypothetical protein C7R54_21720 [Achromobacter aloeverae]